jgi:glycosyltransferase involved in cell wall biosynthesis
MQHHAHFPEHALRAADQAVVRLFGDGERGPEPLRIALIGSYAPRSCGIATFTADIRAKLGEHCGEIRIDVYALDDGRGALVYADDIHVIRAETTDDYREAAQIINDRGTDVVWLQHEFGIYGGLDGGLIAELIDRVAAPVVTTFHTVLSAPSESQRAVVCHLLARCARIMVMSQQGRDLMVHIYHARPDSIEIIEHGAPDRPFGISDAARRKLGLAGHCVMTTFGLLGPDKGIEHVIAAMPAILQRHPEVIYRVLGATHPVLLARDGEAYRESLIALALALGVADNIHWDNRFIDGDELLEQLEAADIYITPYLNLAQSTSGTLSYAVALGKAVVSTPYVHARELLADGVGCLIEPRSSCAIAEAVIGLLDQPDELLAMQRRAHARGRRTVWPHFAQASAQLIRRTRAPLHRRAGALVPPGLGAVHAMSDATGMFQHAVGVVPDRRHGYCVDDNARALMLTSLVGSMSEDARLRWATAYAAFVHYAWNPDTRRFRNFMRFDRTWCETAGSDDSNGRSLWALGHTVECSPLADLREWALGLFDEAGVAMGLLHSPRAMAFAALGALAVLRTDPAHGAARAIVQHCGETLERLAQSERRGDWAWFEAVLGYDNPRLCQALIEGGMALGVQAWIDTGLATLIWISDQQTSAQGHFRPIGSESFGEGRASKPFDQQPLEAQAAIEAARSAWLATRDDRWLACAERAYAWFFGMNDRGVIMGDLATGRCRDGITPHGHNRNSGAESILAFQLGHYSLAALRRSGAHEPTTRTDLGDTDERPRPSPDAHSGAAAACGPRTGGAAPVSSWLAGDERTASPRAEPGGGCGGAERGASGPRVLHRPARFPEPSLAD